MIALVMDLSPSCLGLEPGRKFTLPLGLNFWYYIFIAKSNNVLPKNRRGRPATGRDPVTAIRLSIELRESVDAWAAKQPGAPGRSEAIRRLIELGLKARRGNSNEIARADPCHET